MHKNVNVFAKLDLQFLIQSHPHLCYQGFSFFREIKMIRGDDWSPERLTTKLYSHAL